MIFLILSSAFLVVILNIGLGFFVWLKNKKNLNNIFFAVFSISIGLWILSSYLAIFWGNVNFFGRLGFISSIATISFLFLFAYIFSYAEIFSIKKFILILFPPIIFIIFSFADFMVKNIRIENYHLLGEFGPAYPYYRFFVIFYVFSAIFILIKKYFKSSGFEKIQIKYIFLGIGLFAFPTMITNLILPGFLNIRDFNAFGPLFSIFMVGFISYAIVRHQLLDIKVIIQRGIIYSILLAIIVGFYLLVIFILESIFREITSSAVIFSAGLTVVLGIFSVPIIEKYFRRLTDKIFFKDKYDYSLALHELSSVLNKNLETEKILSVAFEKIRKIFKVNEVDFVMNVKDDEEISNVGKRRGAKLALPVRLENETIGALFLGEKLSGDHYSGEDITLLKTFSHQAAVALKKAELYEKVKKYSKELEEKVKRRTAKIEKLQIEQRQVMIDISHSLQTPLTVIKGELEFIEKQLPKNFKEKIGDKLNIFGKSIDGVSKLIYDLLKLAKLESQEDGFEKEKVDLSRLLENLIEYFNIIVENKKILLESRIAKEVYIVGDERKLEELIINLLSNAVKYIANDRKIFVKLYKSGEFAKFIIEDTGIGIAKKDLPNIFNRFYRVKEFKNFQKGTGLGLAICKTIVEKHGGKIKVKSRIKKGTKFIIILPIN
ncbi:hypothetical protein HZC33_02020 [Candidatus Wolfebacteria bacterium]|nr:hypothetical protein [Candidatus Wolfebacteria bacterium]